MIPAEAAPTVVEPGSFEPARHFYPRTLNAQIHPLVAIRWSRRLRDHVVIAANDGYLPGRVNFAMRNQGGVDMLALLRELDLGPVTGELGFGHPAATGGSLAPQAFARLLALLGFQPR